ncbi:HEPN domain-containing protein [Atrimonas thermophila]|uniref:HEPN domain-containing protein n=1 Tax=Atrimonas thermophila TaxID=3064161 RepID=UPI00399C6A3A
MGNRHQDWLRQAEKGSKRAQRSVEHGDDGWARFTAHQTAEKAVKALHLFWGQEAWGYVVAKLLRELPISVPEELIERGKVLDGYYIPPRYPNGFPEGVPFEHFGSLQTREALEHARSIIEPVRSQMAG